MKIQHIFLLLQLIFIRIDGNAQDYVKADSTALHTKYTGDLRKLSSELTYSLETDLDKSRAIFKWITENIAYDYKAVNRNKKPKRFRCKDKSDCDRERFDFENRRLHKIIVRGKAVCAGYSGLFQRLCEYAGIQSGIVSGYIKNDPSHVGRMGVLDHAWNVIKIDTGYYFVDATWAAGYCVREKGKLKRFIKKFDDFYWLTPQEKLCMDHYPADKIWQEKVIIDKETFKSQPYVVNSFIPKTEIVTPKIGLITVSVGDTIRFNVRYADEIGYIQCNTNLHKPEKPWNIADWNDEEIDKQQYLKFEKENDLYSFYYVVDNERLHYIDIVFDYRETIRYKVTVEKKPATQNSHTAPEQN